MSSTKDKKMPSSEEFYRPKYINKPFARLPLKQRACWILHLAGMSTRDIQKAIGTPYRTVSNYIQRGYKEYPTVFGTESTIVKGVLWSAKNAHNKKLASRYAPPLKKS